jgi:LAS superfamily LD-carboxypeptidase LdcB
MKIAHKLGRNFWIYTGFAFAVLTIAGLGTFSSYEYKEFKKLKSAHTTTLSELETAKRENAGLELSLRDEEYARDNIEKQLGSLGNTLGTLEKLSQTDEELLKKYSKVYFLNENYTPSKLADIDTEFTFPKGNKLQIHGDVKSYLENMLKGAKSAGVDLLVASAFRSYDTQISLKNSYKMLYGSGANQFSADQGYSEHQLGTTVDFTTSAVGGVFSTFEDDSTYKWLNSNAYKYGFVLSYPKGNAYYKFEPWHWRFVGVKLATYLHNENKYFYDLDQREIDNYLVKIFD